MGRCEKNLLDAFRKLPLCVVITSAEGGYVFTSVCLSVCPSDKRKSCERILTKFLGGVGHGRGTNEFNFVDDSDHRPNPGVRSPKSGFTGLSIMLAFGGGLRSLSTSSLISDRFSSLVHNYGTKLAATREICDEILQRLKFTGYALGHSKARTSVTFKSFSSLLCGLVV